MGYISTLFLEKAAEATAFGASARREARRSVFRSVGADPDAPPDSKAMIPDSDFFALLEGLYREHPDGHAIPLRVGASMRCDDYGAFGLAFKSATELGGSYKRVERYGKIVTSIANFRLINGTGNALMSVIPDDGMRLGLKLTNELAVSAAAALSHEVAQEEFRPSSVTFRHNAPADISEHKARFGCPVHFGADIDALDVPDALLRAPNRLGDAQISEFFDGHLDSELTDLPTGDDLCRRVRARVAQALSEGVPAVADVAEDLGMSARTLQRRLSERGLAFQDLIDEARQDLAERLLSRTEYALAEIAFLTGFAEQSSFTRAFKRWSGQTPASYRRDV